MKTENLLPPDKPRTEECPDCHGSGEDNSYPKFLTPIFLIECETCNGTGEIPANTPCDICVTPNSCKVHGCYNLDRRTNVHDRELISELKNTNDE